MFRHYARLYKLKTSGTFIVIFCFLIKCFYFTLLFPMCLYVENVFQKNWQGKNEFFLDFDLVHTSWSPACNNHFHIRSCFRKKTKKVQIFSSITWSFFRFCCCYYGIFSCLVNRDFFYVGWRLMVWAVSALSSMQNWSSD